MKLPLLEPGTVVRLTRRLLFLQASAKNVLSDEIDLHITFLEPGEIVTVTRTPRTNEYGSNGPVYHVFTQFGVGTIGLNERRTDFEVLAP